MRKLIAVAFLAALSVATPAVARGYHAHHAHHSFRASHYYGPSGGRHYHNVDGYSVHSPMHSARRPRGASAHCADGSWSFSQHARGTCSHHGGVSGW